MKIKIVTGLILVGSVLFFCPLKIFAYSASVTHGVITSETVKVFNYYNSNQSLSSVQIDLLVKGSIEEDTPPRWLNHFYDPVHQIGLRGLMTSKNWAENTTAQAAILNKLPLAEYFSASTDYSWERAIYDYVYGDKNRAIEALGHILHLIQDATVPDHTRDDMHPLRSTYEKYAKELDSTRFKLADNLINQKQTPIVFGSLAEYFDYLASFSNNNFFSDDTILIKEYKEPRIVNEKYENLSDGKQYLFGYDEKLKNSKLVRIDKERNIKTGEIVKSYTLEDIDQKIPDDYWKNLSPKAVLAGAGVIQLFFEEVEKEKQSGRLKDKNKSLAKKILTVIDRQVDNLLAGISLLKPNFLTNSILVDSLSSLNKISTEPLLTISSENLEENQPDIQSEIDEMAEIIQKLKIQLSQIITRLADQVASDLILETESVLAETRQTLPSGASYYPVTVSDIVNVATSSKNLLINSPVIVQPADFSQVFATDTVMFVGLASPNLIIFNDFNKNLTPVDEEGRWSVVLSELPHGQTEISFYVRDNDNNISLPTTINLQTDYLPLAISLTIADCSRSLLVGSCLLKTPSSLNFSWSPSGENENYLYDLIKYEKDWGEEWLEPEIVASLSTETEISLDLNFSPHDLLQELKWQIFARDFVSGEIVASSSALITIFHPRPLVINEIGWAGTTFSDLDEWLELRNYLTSYQLNLDNYYLTDSRESWRIDLGGTISANGYYLIERNDDDVIINRPANLTDNFVSDTETKALNPANLGLKLWRQTENGPELIDETPVWNLPSDIPSSMERTFVNKNSLDLSTWLENPGCRSGDGPCALDRQSVITFGTPGVINSASIIRLW